MPSYHWRVHFKYRTFRLLNLYFIVTKEGKGLYPKVIFWYLEEWLHEDCSESNPSYFVTLAITSEADVSGAADVEPSHQYPVTFCCCVTDGSREAVWQKGLWHGGACEAKVCHWIFTSGKKTCTHWHSLMLADYLWSSNSECYHSEVVGGTFQQWWQWCERQATFQTAMQTSAACRLLFIAGENA